METAAAGMGLGPALGKSRRVFSCALWVCNKATLGWVPVVTGMLKRSRAAWADVQIFLFSFLLVVAVGDVVIRST
jgi:hypothetical protein